MSQSFDVGDDDVIDDEEELVKSLKAKKRTKYLTEEEESLPAEEKARLLRQRIRQEREERDKAQALAAEKERLEAAQRQLETRRMLEDLTRQKELDALERERQEKEREKKERLKAEYRAKYGKEPTNEDLIQEQLPRMSKREKLAYYVGRLQKRGKEEDRPAVLKCLKILTTYCKNVKENPQEKKYQKIGKTSRVLQEVVMPYSEAVEVLKLVGFEESAESFEIRAIVPDGFTLSVALDLLTYSTNYLQDH